MEAGLQRTSVWAYSFPTLAVSLETQERKRVDWFQNVAKVHLNDLFKNVLSSDWNVLDSRIIALVSSIEAVKIHAWEI